MECASARAVSAMANPNMVRLTGGQAYLKLDSLATDEYLPAIIRLAFLLLVLVRYKHGFIVGPSTSKQGLIPHKSWLV